MSIGFLSGCGTSVDRGHGRPASVRIDRWFVRFYAIIIRNPMSKSNSRYDSGAADRDLYSGLVRLHVLHHAVQGPIFGLGMIEELARHGYRISAGSLYPLLHRMEQVGYLRAAEIRNGKSLRKVYRATPQGRRTARRTSRTRSSSSPPPRTGRCPR